MKYIYFSLFFLTNNAQSKILNYKKCIITLDGIILYDIKFKYYFLDGQLGQFYLKKDNKDIEFKKANFKLYDHDNDNNLWDLHIESGLINHDKQMLNDITLTNEDASLLSIEKLEIKKEEQGKVNKVIMNNGSVTPCSDVICWVASCDNISIDEDEIIIQRPKFGIESLSIPWFDLRIQQSFSSGFLKPIVQKDEFDGWHTKLPIYLYFSDHAHAKFTPYFGETIGLDVNNQLLNDSTIWSLRFHTKYISFNEDKLGTAINFKNEKAEYEGLDIDLLFASSSEYAQYWENKENQKNRLFIPSYIYYVKNSLIFGTAFDPALVQNTYFYPTIMMNQSSLYKGWVARFELGLNAIISNEVKKCELGHSWLVISGTFNKNTHAYFSSLEIGLDMEFMKNDFMVLPFIQMNINKIFKIGDIKLSILNNESIVPIYISPYMNATLGYPYFFSESKQSKNNPFNSLCKNENIKLRNPLFNFGIKIPIKSFELDCSLGISNHMQATHIPIDFIAQFKYVNEYFSFFIKDAVCLNNYLPENISFGVDFNSSWLNFSVEYLTLNASYKDKLFYDDSHVSTELSWKMTKNLSVNGNLIFKINPDKELAQSGIKLIYKHKCWLFSFGVGYGNIFGIENDDKPFFNFSISINGVDKFYNVLKRFKDVKLDDIDFANKIIDEGK